VPTKKKTPDRFDRREPKTLTEKVRVLSQLFKELDETVGIMLNAGQDERYPVSRKEFEEFKLVILQEMHKKVAHQPLKQDEVLAQTMSLLRTEFNQRLINMDRDLNTRFQNITNHFRAEVNGLSMRLMNIGKDLDNRFQNINLALQKTKEKSESVTWNSADGPVAIRNMSDEHIVNTLRMITRRHAPKMVRAALGNMPEPFSQEYTNKLKALLSEADRRKLSWEPMEVPLARNF
jgi:hypothetical protein